MHRLHVLDTGVMHFPSKLLKNRLLTQRTLASNFNFIAVQNLSFQLLRTIFLRNQILRLYYYHLATFLLLASKHLCI
jgi:hypothetical protein